MLDCPPETSLQDLWCSPNPPFESHHISPLILQKDYSQTCRRGRGNKSASQVNYRLCLTRGIRPLARASLFLSVYMKKKKRQQTTNFLPSRTSPVERRRAISVSPCCQRIPIEEKQIDKKQTKKRDHRKINPSPAQKQ